MFSDDFDRDSDETLSIFKIGKKTFPLFIKALIDRIPIAIVGKDDFSISEFVAQFYRVIPFREPLIFFTDFISQEEYDAIKNLEAKKPQIKRKIVYCSSNEISQMKIINDHTGWIFGISIDNKEDNLKKIVANLKTRDNIFLLIDITTKEIDVKFMGDSKKIKKLKFNLEKELYDTIIKKTMQDMTTIKILLERRGLSEEDLMIFNFSEISDAFNTSFFNFHLLELYYAAQRYSILLKLAPVEGVTFNNKEIKNIVNYKTANIERLQEFSDIEWGYITSFSEILENSGNKQDIWEKNLYELDKETLIFILYSLINRIPILITGNENENIDEFGLKLTQIMDVRQLITLDDKKKGDEVELILGEEFDNFKNLRNTFFCSTQYSKEIVSSTNAFKSFVLCYKDSESANIKNFLKEFGEKLDASGEFEFFLHLQNESGKIKSHLAKTGLHSVDISKIDLELENYIYNKTYSTKETISKITYKEIFYESELKTSIHQFYNAVSRITALGFPLSNLKEFQMDEEESKRIELGKGTILKTADFSNVKLEILIDFILKEFGLPLEIGTGDDFEDNISGVI